MSLTTKLDKAMGRSELRVGNDWCDLVIYKDGDFFRIDGDETRFLTIRAAFHAALEALADFTEGTIK